jgi:citrate/tricarballylate utilization protein
MGELDALVREATALAQGAPASGTAESEAARQLQICNACRYCESFCAVFPAMTRRLAFPAADVHYLANLCHNCGACLHACQYAPPHEFGVNIPRAMAQVRVRTYEDYAWPRAFGALYRRNGMAVAMALVVAIAAFLMASAARTDAPANANFYAVFSHGTMATLFGAAFLWAVLALGIGAARFWRGQHPGAASGPAMAEAAKNALTLTYLDGGHGEGCNESSDRFTLARRHFHHATFYGFLLCFASTCVATLYHYALGLHAPYAITSLPVVLGTLGGIGLVVDPKQRPMDRAFILLLLLVSFTGLALLAWRGTAAMPVLLAAHLGTVMALFLTLPYGKFAHAVYRCAALLKHTIEKRQPSRLALGSD